MYLTSRDPTSMLILHVKEKERCCFDKCCCTRKWRLRCTGLWQRETVIVMNVEWKGEFSRRMKGEEEGDV